MSEALLIKFLLDSTTPEETEEIFNWLNESRENRLKYFATKRIFLESHSTESPDVDHSWERMKLAIIRSAEDKTVSGLKANTFSLKVFLVAASISLLVLISGFLGLRLQNLNRNSAKLNEVKVPFGSRISMVLADGSKVWLNSGSKLTYQAGFGIKERAVNLTGEAFFDIVHNQKVPFVVTTSDLKIKVLGTVFNVKSYPDDKVIETTLVRGKIEVKSLNTNDTKNIIVLAPHEKLIYTKAGNTLTRTSIVKEDVSKPRSPDLNAKTQTKIQVAKIEFPENDGSWKDGKLILKSENLEDLARELERYYNVQISFQNDSIKHIKFSGVLDQVTIEEVLKAISSTSPIRYKIDKNVINLSYMKKR